MNTQRTTTLKRTLQEIQSDVDDIKTSMTSDQYNQLSKKLKAAYDLTAPTTAEYKLTLWHCKFNIPEGELTMDKLGRKTYHYMPLERREFNEILRAILRR